MIYMDGLKSEKGGIVDKLMGGTLVLLMSVLVAIPWMVIVAIPFILVGGLAISPGVYIVWSVFKKLQSPKSLRVLVADDDKVSTAPLLAALAHRRVEVLFVENGFEALGALKEQKFDMLFLDMMMPGLSGAGVLREGEHTLSSRQTTPVIFYTGHQENTTDVLSEKFNLFKVNGVWGKNLSVPALDRRLEQVFAVA